MKIDLIDTLHDAGPNAVREHHDCAKQHKSSGSSVANSQSPTDVDAEVAHLGTRPRSGPVAGEIDRVDEIDGWPHWTHLNTHIAREAAAKQIGIRTATLDKLVKKKRRELGLDKQDNADAGQGRPITNHRRAALPRAR